MGTKDDVARFLLTHTPLKDRDRRRKFVGARRRIFEAAGSARYSRPANHDLDRILERYLPRSGVFVEAGANDGFTTSNTYYLERWRGWRGVLIEAIPSLYEECRRLRSRSSVRNCALVPFGFPEDRVTMTFADICSVVKGSEPGLERLIADRPEGTHDVAVPAMTLTDVLDAAGVEHIDFLSLDVEGFEVQALGGLDFERHAPDWMLVEVSHGQGRPAVENLLGSAYAVVDQLTPDDVLYRRTGESTTGIRALRPERSDTRDDGSTRAITPHEARTPP